MSKEDADAISEFLNTKGLNHGVIGEEGYDDIPF